MSKFSGRCDLYDTISMCGGFSDDESNFKCFKDKTHGVIYKKCLLSVNNSNIKSVIDNYGDDVYSYVDEYVRVPDKRTKDGFRTKLETRYFMYNKEVDKKDLIKNGIFFCEPIYFDKLSDLVPFFPFLVRYFSSYDNKVPNCKVVIFNESYIDELDRLCNDNGLCCEITKVFRLRLKQYYDRQIIKENQGGLVK